MNAWSRSQVTVLFFFEKKKRKQYSSLHISKIGCPSLSLYISKKESKIVIKNERPAKIVNDN